jgi:hypothetical protein
MTNCATIGSTRRISAARADKRPSRRWAMTLVHDLKAGTRLWLSAWTKEIAGADFISISAEIAGSGGPRKRRIGR